MHSEEQDKTPTKHVVTPLNWRQYGDRIHLKAMEKMEVEPTSFEAAQFLALAMGGEMGELQNVVKKMWRDGQSEELFEQLWREAADVLIYFDHFMNLFKLQATVVIVKKLQELVERWPEYFEDWEPTQPTVQ